MARTGVTQKSKQHNNVPSALTSSPQAGSAEHLQTVRERHKASHAINSAKKEQQDRPLMV